jgi:hypothetical protein
MKDCSLKLRKKSIIRLGQDFKKFSEGKNDCQAQSKPQLAGIVFFFFSVKPAEV